MVEVSLTLFATALSTIIVVTMTTLFFCCWRKKGSRALVTSKSNSTKEDVKKERSVSPAPLAVERVENGIPAENASTPGLLVTSEDLGDFSAVQRETEILRSYRKPPPPKNRARQSRAPRHMKNDTESIDIFTELTEEDGKNENSSDKENVSPDEHDSALLRPRSEGKDRPTREARSSMLMDIEQTLASLHTSEPSTTSLSVEGSLSEDKISHTPFSITVTKDIQDEKLEADAGDDTVSASKSYPLETLSPIEVPSEAVSRSATSSPKLNHSGKPKLGPKVSPKPSPRSSARISSVDISTTSGVELEKQAEPSVVNSLSQSQLFDSKGSPDHAVTSQHCSPSHTEVETTETGIVQGSTSSGMQTIQMSPPTLVDHTEPDALSIPDITIRDELTSEVAVDNSDKPETVQLTSEDAVDNSDKPETVQLPSDSTNASENPISDTTNDSDASNVGEDNRRSNCVSEAGDNCDPATKEQPESKTHVSDKQGEPVPSCAEDVPQSPSVETTLEKVIANVQPDGGSPEENTTVN